MIRALVTGGSGTIGEAICRELARQGKHVFVHGFQNKEGANRIVKIIQKGGGTAESVFFDVTDAASTKKALDQILTEGPIQVLVNNAGVYDDGPMAGFTIEQWQRVIDVSLRGFFTVTQPLLLPMIRMRWGRIISVSSISGERGNRGQTNYAAAKGGLHSASKSLALEVADRGVTVNVVAPGLIQSPAIEQSFTPEQVEQLVPMKRAGTPEEVAALIGFLASEQASYISGQVIGVNGGLA